MRLLTSAIIILELALSTVGTAFASRCTDLNGLKVQDSLVRQALDVRAGGASTVTGSMDGLLSKNAIAALPAFCLIVASTGVSRHSNIIVELWLPEAGAWNGKFLGTGNGGFGGVIRYDELVGGIERGYAVANTDMGTFPAGMLGEAAYSAGTNHPNAVKDWAYRSTHEMTVLGALLTRIYYSRRPQESYFAGCSTGGQQALMEAQRYPDDYNGIIAGAPGNNRTHLHLAFLQTFLDAHRHPDSYIGHAKVVLVHKAILKACVGKDGGAPGDAYLTDPTMCHFNPRSLVCKPGMKTASCLNPDQVQTLQEAYRGAIDPKDGHIFYPGWVRGSEYLFSLFFGGRTETVDYPGATLIPWAFGPRFPIASFDFDKDLAREDARIGPIVNDLDPNLSAFAAHGGKLIMFQGWADGIVSPLDTIYYYTRIGKATKDRSSFVRLYMAPGMGHCWQGPGADSFGQNVLAAAGHNKSNDLLDALDAWVEDGDAPREIIAAKLGPTGNKIFARPLCPYPEKAEYKGGNVRLARNFKCVKAPPARFVPPAAEYLRGN